MKKKLSDNLKHKTFSIIILLNRKKNLHTSKSQEHVLITSLLALVC